MSQLLHWVEQYGLYAVFLSVLIEQIGLPIPAYPMLIIAGAFVVQGHYTLFELLMCAVAASLLADLFWYAAGARYGNRVLGTLCRLSLSPDTCVRQTESIFDRWGSPSLMVAKFIPGFATVATALSGVLRVRKIAFVFFDGIGAALWAGLAILIGFVFRDAIGDVVEVLNQLGKWGALLLVTCFALFALSKWWQRKRFYKELRMARISVAELRKLMQDGSSPVIVDVRSAESQKRGGRIPGALTLQRVEDNPDLVAILRDAHDVIVYCACPNEASAARIAKQLIQSGAKHVRPLQGGIDAWLLAGFAVERGVDG